MGLGPEITGYNKHLAIYKTTQASVGDLNDIDATQFDAIISTVDLDIALPYITESFTARRRCKSRISF